MMKSCLVSYLINYFNNKQPKVDYSENPAQLPRNFPLSVKKWKGNFYPITLFENILPAFLCRQRREVRPNISSTTCVVFVILWLFYTSHHINRVGHLQRTDLNIRTVLFCGYMSTAKDFCPREQCLFSGQSGYRLGGVLTVWDWLLLEQSDCTHSAQPFHQVFLGCPTSTESQQLLFNGKHLKYDDTKSCNHLSKHKQ